MSGGLPTGLKLLSVRIDLQCDDVGLVDAAVHVCEAFRRAGGRARVVDQPTFRHFDSLRGLRDVGGDLKWDACDAMFVAVQEITGPDGQSADDNRTTILDYVNLGMRNEHARREELEAGRSDLEQVTDAAVRDGP